MDTEQLHSEVRQLQGVVIQLAQAMETIRIHFAPAPSIDDIYKDPGTFLSFLAVMGQRMRDVGHEIPRMGNAIAILKNEQERV